MVYALAVLGATSIGYGISVMMLNSGTLFHLVWFALGAILLLSAWASWSGLLSSLPRFVRWGGRVFVVACLAVLAYTQVLVFGNMWDVGAPNLDYIVVLGAQVKPDGNPSPVLRYRLDAALAYLEENPKTICIVSGGQGPNEPTTEAEAMADFLEDAGIGKSRIVREPRSEDTVQNIRYSMALMDKPGPSVGIVTNGFHVYRAARIAQKAGLEGACGISAYSTPWYLPNNCLREGLGIIKDAMLGNI